MTAKCETCDGNGVLWCGNCDAKDDKALVSREDLKYILYRAKHHLNGFERDLSKQWISLEVIDRLEVVLEKTDIPDLDANQASMEVKKMQGLGFDCYINIYADDSGNNVTFYRQGVQGFRSGFKFDDLNENILLAVKEAKGGK